MIRVSLRCAQILNLLAIYLLVQGFLQGGSSGFVCTKLACNVSTHGPFDNAAWEL